MLSYHQYRGSSLIILEFAMKKNYPNYSCYCTIAIRLRSYYYRMNGKIWNHNFKHIISTRLCPSPYQNVQWKNLMPKILTVSHIFQSLLLLYHQYLASSLIILEFATNKTDSKTFNLFNFSFFSVGLQRQGGQQRSLSLLGRRGQDKWRGDWLSHPGRILFQSEFDKILRSL